MVSVSLIAFSRHKELRDFQENKGYDFMNDVEYRKG